MPFMSTRVYVGGLNYRARERDVEKFFRKFGKIREISLKNGFCFVDFEDSRDADDACYECNGKDFMGERVTVEVARGTPHGRDKDRWGSGGGDRDRGGRRDRSPQRGRNFSRDSRGRPVWLDKYGPPTRTDYRLTIENLSSRVSWQDLKDYMRQAGDVTYADAHKTRRNEGCVEFGNYNDLKTALEKLDGTELNGRKIRLIEDKGSKRSRSRSHSRSRSRTRNRSRSRSMDRSRSRSAGRKSRSRSSGHDRRRSRSRSIGDRKSRSRSLDRKSRSRSRSGGDRRSRSRSVERKVANDKKSASRSRSPSRGRDADSRSRSRSRSRSYGGRSRSGSKDMDRLGNGSRSDEDKGGNRDNGGEPMAEDEDDRD